MTRLQRAALLGTTIVTLLVFGLVIPLFAQLGPSTRLLEEDTVVGTTYGDVTLPAGWNLDIARAAGGSPEIQLRDVHVRVTDGVWFEDSESLLRRVARLVYSNPPPLPAAPDDDGVFSAGAFEAPSEDDAVVQRFDIVADEHRQEGEPLRVHVLKYGELVILVSVRGDDDAVERESEAIAAIVESVTFGVPTTGLEPGP